MSALDIGLRDDHRQPEACLHIAAAFWLSVVRREHLFSTSVAGWLCSGNCGAAPKHRFDDTAAASPPPLPQELSDLYAKFLSAGKTLREHGFTALHHVHLSSEAEERLVGRAGACAQGGSPDREASCPACVVLFRVVWFCVPLYCVVWVRKSLIGRVGHQGVARCGLASPYPPSVSLSHTHLLMCRPSHVDYCSCVAFPKASKNGSCAEGSPIASVARLTWERHDGHLSISACRAGF